MADTTPFRLAGSDNSAIPISKNNWNDLLSVLEVGAHFTTAQYLALTGRDLAADQAFDPLEAVIVPTGTGAFVRPYWESPITDFMFGAENGADNVDALEAWATFVWNVPCAHACTFSSGTIARSILLGVSSGALSATNNYTFGHTIKPTVAMDYLVKLQGIQDANLEFCCEIGGANSASNNVALASRLAKIGMIYHDLHRCQSSGMVKANNFYYHGTAVDPVLGASTTGTKLPYVRGFNFGSSPAASAANQLECTWSNVVRSGTSGSASQRWTCTVTAAPADDPLDYPRYLKIAGYYYKILPQVPPADQPTDPSGVVDNGDGTYTLTFEAPWLDDVSTAAGTGSGSYVFGAPHAHGGGDNSTTVLAGSDGHRNGIGLIDESWYGAKCEYIHHGSESEVTATFGIDYNSGQQGGSIEGGYTEVPPVFIVCGNGSKDRYIGPFGGDHDSSDFSTFFKLGPRVTGSGNLKLQAMHELTVAGHEGKLIIAQNGHTFTTTWDPGSVAAGASTSTTMTVGSPVSGTDFNVPIRAGFSNSLAGCLLTASVTAQSASNSTCTVTITLFNPTAGAVDLTSGTLSITLMK